jgi:hypothetical protein
MIISFYDENPLFEQILPRPLVVRQGGAFHARSELHRIVFVEGVRQGRDHHVGVAADRLSDGGPGPPGVRAARLPPRRGLFLVHLFADEGFQVHVLAAFALFAFWPFTRLVHAFSAPVGYVTRPYVVYRSRDPRAGLRPARPG